VIIPGIGGTLAQAINAVRDLASGGTNASGTLTLAADATVTVVSNEVCTSAAMVTLSPRTPDAAAAIPTTYVSATAKGQFTITHASAATTDRTFDYEIRRR
jgi:hypothetical protein